MADDTAPLHRYGEPPTVPPHVPAHLVIETDFQTPNTDFDPFGRSRDALRDLPPIFYSASTRQRRGHGVWVVSRYEDIREVYQNDALYSTRTIADFQVLVGETWPMIPLSVDPPLHGH